jgi:RNA methyltransferase, TrmH family
MIPMALSRNNIKYLSSLKIKKFRNLYSQFLVEGDKIVSDLLRSRRFTIRQLIATGTWLAASQDLISGQVGEAVEAGISDIARISSLEAPPPVIAVLDMPQTSLNADEITGSWSLVLDNIQDPGNLGTIIRTADWFGIRHVICSIDSADCFNPKVVQSSMGALMNLQLHYTHLPDFMKSLSFNPSYQSYGTFIRGTPLYEVPAASHGLILFGNEARGISEELQPFILSHVTIPAVKRSVPHVESLNVASAAAILCAWLIRK